MSATVAEIRAVLSADASSMVRGLGQAKSATKELQAEVVRTNSTLQTVRSATESAGASMRGVSGAAERASAGLREVGNSARQAEAQTRSFSSAASASQGHLSGMTSMLGKAAFAVGGLFTAMAGYKVFNFAKDAIFGFNSTLQGAQMQMGRMLKSEEQATQFISDLKQFAIQTPFQFEDLIKASQQFLVYGWKVEDIIPDMEAIGSAAMGDAYKIDMITRALGQMRAKGKVSSEEISMQLGESGIPGWRYVAEAFGVTIPEAMKLAEKGALDVETAIQAILGGMRRDFGGGMEAASKTFQGAMSNVKDAAQQALATGFKPLFDAVSGGLLKLATLMMGERFQNAIKAMTDIAAKYAKPLTEFFDNVIKKLETLDPMKAVAGFERLTGSLSGLQAIAGPLIGTLAGFKMAGGGGGFIGFMAGAIISSEEGREAMKKLAEAMAEVAKQVGPELAKALSRMTPAIVAVSQVISNLVIAFSKLPGPVQEFVILGGLAASIFAKFKSPVGFIVGMLNPFAMGMRRAATETGAAADQLARFNAESTKTSAFSGGLSKVGSTLSTMGRGAMSGAMIGGIASTGVAMAGGGTGAQVGSLAGGVLGGAIGSLVAPGAGTVVGGLVGSAAGGLIGNMFDDNDAQAMVDAKQAAIEFRNAVYTLTEALSTDLIPLLDSAGKDGFQNFADAVLTTGRGTNHLRDDLARMGITWEQFTKAMGESRIVGTTAYGTMMNIADSLGLTYEEAGKLLGRNKAQIAAMREMVEGQLRVAVTTGDATASTILLDRAWRDTAITLGHNGEILRDLDDIGQSAKGLEILRRNTKVLTEVADINAKAILRQGGSYLDARGKMNEYQDKMADTLVYMGWSRERAEELSTALFHLPDRKVMKILLEQPEGDVLSRFQSDLNNLKAGLEAGIVPQDVYDAEVANVERVIKKYLEKRTAEQGSVEKSMQWLSWMKGLFPELGGQMDALFAKEIEGVTQSNLSWQEKANQIALTGKAYGDTSLVALAALVKVTQESKASANAQVAHIQSIGDKNQWSVEQINAVQAAVLNVPKEWITQLTADNTRALEEIDHLETRLHNLRAWAEVPMTIRADIFAGIFGGYGAGGRDGDPATPEATGGLVRHRELLLVGERGPELFVPPMAGRIVPNYQLENMRSNPSISAPPFSGMTPVGTTPWDNGGQSGPTDKYVHIENLNVTNAAPNDAANAIVRRLRTEAFLAGN